MFGIEFHFSIRKECHMFQEHSSDECKKCNMFEPLQSAKNVEQ